MKIKPIELSNGVKITALMLESSGSSKNSLTFFVSSIFNDLRSISSSSFSFDVDGDSGSSSTTSLHNCFSGGLISGVAAVEEAAASVVVSVEGAEGVVVSAGSIRV